MNVQSILKINAGFAPPADYLKLLLEKLQPNAMGFVIQDGSNAEAPELAVLRQKEVLTLDQLIELCENAKPWPMLLSFAHFSEPFGDDDIQPFLIKDPTDTVRFALTLEGDFAKFSDVKSGHTEEYNFATTILIPRIEEMCEDFEGDLDKVMSKIGGDVFNNTTFLSHVGHRGVLNVLPFAGDAVLLGKNELGETYDWGTVSQRHTFGDIKQEPVKAAEPVVEKKKGWFTAGGKTTPVVASASTTASKDLPKDVATKGEGPRTSVPAVAKPATQVVAKMPDWIHSNRDKENWYLAVQGTVPVNFKKKIPAVVNYPEALKAKSSKDIDAILLARHGTKITETATPAPAIGDNKAAAAAVENLGKHIAVAESLPIMTPKQLEAALDFVAKHLDGNAQEIKDPSTMQAEENKLKIPTFTEAMGLNEFDPINWSPSGIFALFKEHPEAGALFAIEMRNRWRATVDMKQLVGTKTTKETATAVTTTETTGGTVKTESVAKDAPAAKKKGGWFTKAA